MDDLDFQSSILTYKNEFPFRIGCTSFVYEDNILNNVKKMASWVDDIELVFFESGNDSNYPDAKTVNELKKIAEKNQLTYTVHFPIDKKAGSEDDDERQSLVAQIHKILDFTKPLNPYAYVLHFDGIDKNAKKDDIEIWKENIEEVCTEIVMRDDLENEKICIENTFYPPEWHMDIVQKYGFSVCLDFGHLWLNHDCWEKVTSQLFAEVKVMHLHGIENRKDHLSLQKADHQVLKMLRDHFLRRYQHVLTLEVFNEIDTFDSLKFFHKLFKGD